ncbi:hypothetical protein [Clostridium ihumii]|uniref:hypothetical protein n=1 Tax=Clostridium ihumii TaxID=1470356 RepID=UPI0005915E2D|nr:hypothetical protein [Clostridium ihumii]
MKLYTLKTILNTDMVNIYLNGKNEYFIRTKTNKTYETLDEKSLDMWYQYGEYEIKEIYVEDDMLIIDINQI